MKQTNNFTRRSVSALAVLVMMLMCGAGAFAQTTAFTYQGRLTDGGNSSPTGTYDLRFSIDSGDFLITCNGATTTNKICEDVSVVNGIFTVRLDFGAAGFNGANRTLAIGVRRGDETGVFTPLAPAQPITSAPYAIQSLNATNAANLGGTAASQFVQTNDARLSDSRQPAAGSNNYIQNQNAAAQTSASFNISDDGTAGGTLSANVVNANGQFNFGGSRVLGVPNSTSVTVGLSAGNALQSGNADNTFVGASAGILCRYSANAGDCLGNTFFGKNAGMTFIGGSNNTFIGNGTNSTNPFNGNGAPSYGTSNTLIGAKATLLSPDLDHATAIGADSYVNSSNTVIVGRTSGADQVLIYGPLELPSLAQGGSLHLCIQNQTTFRIQLCSSSLRFKTNVAPFSSGLNLIKQLKPITFDWKSDGHHDLGFGAEDVAKVDPLLAEYDRDGVVSGVKYDRFSALFVNAFKEQQTQIETQAAQIERQQKQIDELKLIVCAIKPDSPICGGNK